MAINAYYFIGTMTNVYTKVYDGKKLQADVLTYDGYLDTDSFQPQITKGNLTHVNQYGTMEYDETLGKNVGTLELHYDEGYPKVFRNGADVTTEYNQTQVADYTFEDKTPGCKTFTIVSRDVTLKSANLTKEYDGKALTAYSQAGGTDVTDVTAGQTDKGYVSGEEFNYTFTGSQLFVGSTENKFDVSDSNTALTSDYNVTKQYGTLTVTGRTTPLTITVADQEKTYDGTAAFDTTAYTVSGELAYNDTITVTLSNTNVDAGTYTNGITADYMIIHDNGDGTYADVTEMYLNVTVDNGDFTINKRNVTITSASDSKVYDGTPLTNDNTAITSGSFVSGEGYVADVTGSQTAIGSSANTFTVSAAAGTNLNNYNVTKVEGELTVYGWDQLITITADSNSQMYDGSALTDSGYTVTGSLAAGHTITVTTAGSIIDAGTADNVVSSYTIYDENGDDVTAAYINVQTVKGTLEVTKRDVTLTSASDEKPYDGTPLTNSNVYVSGDGWANNEGAAYDVTGSQTAIGTSKNTFSYTLNSNTKAGNYSIHSVEGSLTVTPAEFIITIDTEIGSGLEFLYDNTSTKVLTTDQYQVEGLAAGDKVVNVTITTNSANAGTYDEDMYTLSYDIVNAAGESTKSSYIITEYKHDVDITKRTITIAADSASKVYDGTALTCHTYTVEEGATEEYQLLDGEEIVGVGFTADSTITHAGSTANKIDATNVTIDKADGSDSSMNYNILTDDGTLTVTARGVLLASTSAEKYYDGTALQNRQVVITGFYYDDNGNVVVDNEGGFLDGDGCTYDFVNDNVVINKDGEIIAWTQCDTAYGQTEVGTSKNEFNYNNFTSVYAGSFETDYIIMYGFNQEELGLSKDTVDLFGDLTVWGGPVEINMTDYSWTYDYQAKTNGYFDDGYTVVVTTNEEGTEQETTEIAHNSEGYAIALLGSDTIVVNVTGEGGSKETGKVQHVGDDTQNTATYTIYRNGEDVTAEVEEYYDISVDGGLLKITPRTVEIASASDSKRYDGEELVNRTIVEGSEGRDTGFIFGEGAAYEISGTQTAIGTSKNEFAISELLTDTQASDYNFVMTEGDLTVTGGPVSDYNYSNKSDIIQFVNGLVYVTYDNGEGIYEQTEAINDVTGWSVVEMRRDLTGDSLCDVQIISDDGVGSTWVATLRNDYLETGDITLNYQFIGAYDNKYWNYLGSADVNGDGKAEVLMIQTDDGLDEQGHRNVAAWVTDETGTWVDNEWVGALVASDWNVAGTADLDGNGTDNVILRRADGMIGYWSEMGTNDIVEVCNAGDSVMLTTADFSGDGADDFLFTNAAGDFFTWTNVGGELSNVKIGNIDDLGGNWAFAGAGDYNGDGKEELLWCDGVSTAYSEATEENFKNLIQIA